MLGLPCASARGEGTDPEEYRTKNTEKGTRSAYPGCISLLTADPGAGTDADGRSFGREGTVIFLCRHHQHKRGIKIYSVIQKYLWLT